MRISRLRLARDLIGLLVALIGLIKAILALIAGGATNYARCVGLTSAAFFCTTDARCSSLPKSADERVQSYRVF
jgi:hypothetical protein